MWVSQGVERRDCVEVALPDREFFSLSLDLARERVDEVDELVRGYGVETAKRRCPVVYCSMFSHEDEWYGEVPRRVMNERDPKRRYLMGDVDFESGQWDEYLNLRKGLIQLFSELESPLMIYPTMSYPAKPRFRWVGLVKRAIGGDSYARAVHWVYDSVGFEPTDLSDFRVTANRNLPFFWNAECMDAIYETFSDESLKPLDGSLWRGHSLPDGFTRKRRSKIEASPVIVARHGRRVGDPRGLIRAIEDMCASKQYRDYHESWIVLRSLAAAAKAGGISIHTGERCARAVASCAPDVGTRRMWEECNVEILHEEMGRMDDPDDMSKARPLCSYVGLIGAAGIDMAGIKSEEILASDLTEERALKKPRSKNTRRINRNGGRSTRNWKYAHGLVPGDSKRLEKAVRCIITCGGQDRDEIVWSLACAEVAGGIGHDVADRACYGIGGAEELLSSARGSLRDVRKGASIMRSSRPLCKWARLSRLEWSKR